MLDPNKNVQIILKNDHLWSFFNIIYTFFWSIIEPCYIQNGVITNRYKEVVVYMYVFMEKSEKSVDPSRTWQAGGGSFLLLPRRLALSSWWLWTFNHNLAKPPERSSRSCYQFSLPANSLSRQVAMCIALVCGAQCSMPVRFGHLQSQTSNVCREMTGQWSDRSAMSSRKTLSPPDSISSLHGLALRIWTSFWKREGSAGMDIWNALMVHSRQPLTYRLMENVGLGGPRWLGSSWQRGIAESGSKHTWGSGVRSVCSKPATWKGAHWCGCCPCTCMLIKNPMMMTSLWIDEPQSEKKVPSDMCAQQRLKSASPSAQSDQSC